MLLMAAEFLWMGGVTESPHQHAEVLQVVWEKHLLMFPPAAELFLFPFFLLMNKYFYLFFMMDVKCKSKVVKLK